MLVQLYTSQTYVINSHFHYFSLPQFKIFCLEYIIEFYVQLLNYAIFDVMFDSFNFLMLYYGIHSNQIIHCFDGGHLELKI